jgi:hypothetical protein
MLTTKQLEDIKGRVDAVSILPWKVESDGQVLTHLGDCMYRVALAHRQQDQEFIANAPQDVQALLAALAQVTRERNELAGICASARLDGNTPCDRTGYACPDGCRGAPCPSINESRQYQENYQCWLRWARHQAEMRK